MKFLLILAVLGVVTADDCAETGECCQCTNRQQLKIAFISHLTDSAERRLLEAGVDQSAKDRDVILTKYANNPFNEDKAFEAFDKAIEENYDGIITTYRNKDTDNIANNDFAGLIKKATSKKIPVYVVGSTTDEMFDDVKQIGLVNYVGMDEKAAAQQAAQKLIDTGVKKLLCLKFDIMMTVLTKRCEYMTEVFTNALGADSVQTKAPGMATYAYKPIVEASLEGGFLGGNDKVGIVAIGATQFDWIVDFASQINQMDRLHIITYESSLNVIKEMKSRQNNQIIYIDQQYYLQGYVPLALLVVEKQSTQKFEVEMPTGPRIVTRADTATTYTEQREVCKQVGYPVCEIDTSTAKGEYDERCSENHDQKDTCMNDNKLIFERPALYDFDVGAKAIKTTIPVEGSATGCECYDRTATKIRATSHITKDFRPSWPIRSGFRRVQKDMQGILIDWSIQDVFGYDHLSDLNWEVANGTAVEGHVFDSLISFDPLASRDSPKLQESLAAVGDKKNIWFAFEYIHFGPSVEAAYNSLGYVGYTTYSGGYKVGQLLREAGKTSHVLGVVPWLGAVNAWEWNKGLIDAFTNIDQNWNWPYTGECEQMDGDFAVKEGVAKDGVTRVTGRITCANWVGSAVADNFFPDVEKALLREPEIDALMIIDVHPDLSPYMIQMVDKIVAANPARDITMVSCQMTSNTMDYLSQGVIPFALDNQMYLAHYTVAMLAALFTQTQERIQSEYFNPIRIIDTKSPYMYADMARYKNCEAWGDKYGFTKNLDGQYYPVCNYNPCGGYGDGVECSGNGVCSFEHDHCDDCRECKEDPSKTLEECLANDMTVVQKAGGCRCRGPEHAEGVCMCEQSWMGTLCNIPRNCDPGEEITESGCQACSPGHYSPGGDSSTAVCKACEPGYFNTEFGVASCQKAANGYWWDHANTTAELSLINSEIAIYRGNNPGVEGTDATVYDKIWEAKVQVPADVTGTDKDAYLVEARENELKERMKCPIGTSRQEGDSRCEPCKPGYFAFSKGSRKCTPCAKGRYASEYGSAECNACGGGRTTMTDKSKYQDIHCICPEGSFWRMPDANCVECGVSAKTGLECKGGHQCKTAAGALHSSNSTGELCKSSCVANDATCNSFCVVDKAHAESECERINKLQRDHTQVIQKFEDLSEEEQTRIQSVLVGSSTYQDNTFDNQLKENSHWQDVLKKYIQNGKQNYISPDYFDCAGWSFADYPDSVATAEVDFPLQLSSVAFLSGTTKPKETVDSNVACKCDGADKPSCCWQHRLISENCAEIAHDHRMPELIPGFWAASVELNKAPLVLKCRSVDECIGGRPGEMCAAHRTGSIACSDCDPDFFPVKGKCKACTSGGATLPFIFAALGLFCAVVVAHLACNSEMTAQTSSLLVTSISSGLLMQNGQMMMILGQISLSWNEPFSSIVKALSFLQFDVGLLNPECVFASVSPFGTYLMRMMIPGLIAVGYVLAYLISRAAPQGSMMRMDSRKLINTLGMWGQAFFITLALNSVLPLNCQKNPGVIGHDEIQPRTNVKYPNVICGEGETVTYDGNGVTFQFLQNEASGLLIVGIIFFILYVIGFVCVIAYIWNKIYGGDQDVLADPDFRVKFRWFMFRFSPNYFWFGTVIIVRNLLIAFVPIIFPDDFHVCLLILSTVMLVHSQYVTSIMPWRTNVLNALDVIVSISFTLISFSAFHYYPGDRWNIPFFDVFVVLLTVFALVVIGTVIIQSLLRMITKGNCSYFIWIDQKEMDQRDRVSGALSKVMQNINSLTDSDIKKLVKGLSMLDVNQLLGVLNVVDQVLCDGSLGTRLSRRVSYANRGSTVRDSQVTSRYSMNTVHPADEKPQTIGKNDQ